MSGDAKNSEINSVAIYSRLTKNMSQIDWTSMDVTASSIKRIHHTGSIYPEEDEEGKQYERQQVIVKFKNWESRTKVYKTEKIE